LLNATEIICKVLKELIFDLIEEFFLLFSLSCLILINLTSHLNEALIDCILQLLLSALDFFNTVAISSVRFWELL
jgi:hypothetical protein